MGGARRFIRHRCFSPGQQCSIVSTKISGSTQRRPRYYYAPAKFRSLFSFFRVQRAHNLLSTMRRATKLHCCSANRLVLVDGSTRCEVCLSAEAARRLFGNSIPPAGPKEQREQEETRETEGKNSKQLFLSPRPPHHLLFLLLSLWQGGKFGWRASERKKESKGGRKGASWRASER